MEFLTPKQQVVIGTLFSLFEAMCQVNTALYFRYISQNYFWYAFAGLVFSSLSAIGTMIFVDESLLFLLKTNRIEEANEGLERMLRVSGVRQETLDDSRSTASSFSIRSAHTLHHSLLKPKTMFKKYEMPPSNKESIWSQVDRKVIFNLVVMTFIWCAVGFGFFLVNFQLKYLPGSIYTNCLASGASGFCAILIGGFVYKKLGLKPALQMSFLISLIGAILILSLDTPTLMPVFTVLANFGMASGFTILFVSNVDLYPTLFTATALGIGQGFSNFAIIFAP